MKKIIIILVLLFAATVIFAQSVQLGQFPIGKWLDPNWNAIWEFTSNNIRILNSNTGEVYFDFSGKIQNFKVFVDGAQPGISFSCFDTEKTYSFKANLTNNNVVLEIDREDKPKYTVTMRKQ